MAAAWLTRLANPASARGLSAGTEPGARVHPEVLAAYTITGDSDALLHLRTAGIQELEAVVERIRLHPNAERTNSRIVLSRLVHRPSA